MGGDRLSTYNQKRDFSRTPEPAGRVARPRTENLSFLVQKHAARRLHYDLRLEWDGVLLSWAVTRGPSPDPAQKRLAVRTEDHPISYGDFEGTIQKGEYGGGTVMLWDRGSWEPVDDPEEGLKAGKLHFRIHGERMKGGWILVRIRGNEKDRKAGRENWLLIKERDEQAGDDPEALVTAYTTSIKTTRDMDAIARNEPALAPRARPAARARAGAARSGKKQPAATRRDRQLATPAFLQPQLATLVDAAPGDDKWLHEVKFDGYRCLAALGRDGVRLYTRSGLDWSDRFSPLVPALETLECRNALIDGEVMAAGHEASSAFSALQQSLKSGAPLIFYAFDLLVLDGEDLTSRPLIERKNLLEALLDGQPEDSSLRYSTHIVGHGPEIHEKVCRSGGEGIVAKKLDAPYRGTRTRVWLKVKCTRRQEFVIGGFSPSAKRGRGFSSLILGNFEDGRFIYRGRVGSGFDDASLQTLHERLKALETDAPTFDAVPASLKRTAHWVKPDLVVEVDFSEFTADGHIRHGVFLGLREDKPAQQVHPEEVKHLDEAATDAEAQPSIKAGKKKKADEVAGIRISSGEREIFPQAGVTKLDLARYYELAGERLVAIAGHRPFSLVRCPRGITGECFFQKHATKGFPSQLKSIDIEESSGKTGRYLYVDSTDGLVAAAQMGVIEFHVWGARNDRLDRPDRLVFDLDPEEGLAFEQVRQAAFQIRDHLRQLGLESTPLLTGGKGVHVCVPLKRTLSWDTLKLFSRTVATLMAETEPELFTEKMSKAKRKGKIFIDWLRNDRGSTAISPYSARARQGAPVAVPITWQELKTVPSGNCFSVKDMARRLRTRCPYLKALESPQGLGAEALKRLETIARNGGFKQQ